MNNEFMSTIKIEYNPYKQIISYKFLSRAGWIPVTKKSKLTVDKYQRATLQSVVEDITEIIVHDYATDNDRSVRILFCGTDEDYADLKESIENSPKRIKSEAKIILERDQTAHYCSASTAAKDITNIFEDLKQRLLEQNDEEINRILLQYGDASSNTIPICVIGGFSHGKSMFINALIGEDILPTAAQPETALVFKITSSARYRVSFTCKGQDLCFEIVDTDGTPIVRLIRGNEDIGPCADWIRRLTGISGNSKVDIMREVLAQLNKSDDTGLICVEIPFRHSTLPTDIRFEIYDTPGSGSHSYEKHFETLKESLSERTNGLPILITTLRDLDSAAEKDVFDSLEKTGKSLDRENLMILMNQADNITAEALSDYFTSQGNSLTLQQSRSCIIPLSSLMALGCKRSGNMDNWKDNENYSLFEVKFSNPEKQYYRSLPQYSILPQSRKDSILAKVEEAETAFKKDTKNDDARRELIAQNSSIRAVESEIAYYAQRRADYNKCKSAAGYLDQAIEAINKKLQPKLQDIKDKEEEIEKERDDFRNNLIDQLTKKADEVSKIARESSAKELARQDGDEMEKLLSKTLGDDTFWPKLFGGNGEISDLYRRHKNDKDYSVLQSKINARFRKDAEEYYDSFESICKEYWEKQAELLKSSLIQVVNGNKDISSEERNRLSDCILSVPWEPNPPAFDIRKKEVVSRRKFYLRKSEKINMEKCRKEFKKSFENDCHDVAKQYLKHYTEEFLSLKQKLIEDVTYQLDDFNPELGILTRKLKQTEKEVHALQNEINLFAEKQQKIYAILSRQEELQ